jgi:hypothetical protein
MQYISSLLTFQRALLLPFSSVQKMMINFYKATCHDNAKDSNFLLQVVNMLMLDIANVIIVLMVLAIEGNCK